MDRIFYPITGLEAVYIAESIIDSIDSYSAGTPEYFAPSSSAEWAEEQEATEDFYDNKLQDVYYGLARSSIVLRISGISAKKDASIRGKKYIASAGRVAGTNNSEPPLCALGLKINKGQGDYIYIWFPKGRFSGGNVVASTKNNGVTINTLEYTFTALETDKQFDVNGEQTGITWFKGDTTDPAFGEAGWFSQVQTPDTTSAPAALALSSSSPVDEATGVAVDVSPELTFNNKVSSYNITMIDPATLAVIAASFSLDATQKILTINPDSDLSALTEYAIIVSKVTDVYGQALSDTVINFTTA